jgi:hypothetical protein
VRLRRTAVGGICLLAAGGAASTLATAAPARERAAVVVPIQMTLVYTETDHGQPNPDNSIGGIVGRGTFTLALHPTSGPVPVLRAPAKKKPKAKAKGKNARKAKPKPVTLALASVATGHYVTRYDIAADGGYHGILVATFGSSRLGSLCLAGSVAFGSYVPGDPFPPSTITLTSVGGTGLGALLRAALSLQPTAISGLDTQQVDGAGTMTASLSTSKPLTGDCLAVAQLGH